MQLHTFSPLVSMTLYLHASSCMPRGPINLICRACYCCILTHISKFQFASPFIFLLYRCSPFSLSLSSLSLSHQVPSIDRSFAPSAWRQTSETENIACPRQPILISQCLISTSPLLCLISTSPLLCLISTSPLLRLISTRSLFYMPHLILIFQCLISTSLACASSQLDPSSVPHLHLISQCLISINKLPLSSSHVSSYSSVSLDYTSSLHSFLYIIWV